MAADDTSTTRLSRRNFLSAAHSARPMSPLALPPHLPRLILNQSQQRTWTPSKASFSLSPREPSKLRRMGQCDRSLL